MRQENCLPLNRLGIDVDIQNMPPYFHIRSISSISHIDHMLLLQAELPPSGKLPVLNLATGRKSAFSPC